MAMALGASACEEAPPPSTSAASADGRDARETPPPDASAGPSAATSSTATADGAAAPSGSAPAQKAKGPFPASTHPALLDPKKAKLTAPDTFEARFETTAGDFVVACTRSWAPHAADRFYNLLKIGFYDDVAIYRVHPEFVVQWGLSGDPAVSAAWQKAELPPDKVTQKNTEGTLTFAQIGDPTTKGMTATTRATQVFINYQDNDHLDQAFAPVCKVTEGFEVTKTFGGDKLHKFLAKQQGRIMEKGNAFLRQNYPELDYVKKAYVVQTAAPATSHPRLPPP